METDEPDTVTTAYAYGTALYKGQVIESGFGENPTGTFEDTDTDLQPDSTYNPNSGALYNPGDVAAYLEAEAAANNNTWGTVTRSASGAPSISITDAQGYVDWLNSTHYAGGMHALTQERIRDYVDRHYVQTGSALPPRGSMPGTHAEIFVFDQLLHELTAAGADVNDPEVLASISIATFSFDLGAHTGGDGFVACVHCSGIIPPEVTVLAGYRSPSRAAE